MPVTPRSVEAFLAVLETCSTVESLFAAFEHEIASEGFGDVVFALIGENPSNPEVTLGEAADHAALLQELKAHYEHDALLLALETAGQPSTWIDRLMSNAPTQVASSEPDSVVAALSRGILEIASHSPGRECNLIGLRIREGCNPKPERLPIVKLKAYATIDRYEALRAKADGATGILCQLPFEEATAACQHAQACNLTAQIPDGSAGDGATRSECWALALVDIAARRYRAGLLDLNERVFEIVGQAAIRDYMARGLIKEEPDDSRFNFVFQPTRMGQHRLKSCPCVSLWRAQVWSDYVEVHERPVD